MSNDVANSTSALAFQRCTSMTTTKSEIRTGTLEAVSAVPDGEWGD